MTLTFQVKCLDIVKYLDIMLQDQNDVTEITQNNLAKHLQVHRYMSGTFQANACNVLEDIQTV